MERFVGVLRTATFGLREVEGQVATQLWADRGAGTGPTNGKLQSDILDCRWVS